MPCLICQWFHPTEPFDHRAARESDSCDYVCGSTWNNDTAINYVHNHKEPLDGFCLLNPAPRAVSSAEVCGQISPVEPRRWWLGNAYKPLTQDESLMDWARRTYTLILEGHWREQQREEIMAENKRLKQQLKVARERSAKRLAKLQKLQAKEPDKQSSAEIIRLPDVAA